LTWILFLTMANKFSIKNGFDADYLLISVMYLMVRYSFDYLKPKNAPKIKANNKTIISSILKKLFQIFLIEDVSCFKSITAIVDDYFDELITKQVIICQNFQNYDFLSPHLINLNYKKIDGLYLK
jgi:hypothetical protein